MVLKKAECPFCHHVFYVVTTNKYSKKKRCPNCGNVRNMRLK